VTIFFMTLSSNLTGIGYLFCGVFHEKVNMQVKWNIFLVIVWWILTITYTW